MRILFLSVDFPLPADRGLRARTLGQLRLLGGMESVESITLLSLRNAEVPEARVHELASEVPKLRIVPPVFQPVHMRRHPRTLPRLLRLRFLNRVPYIVAKCDNLEMRRLVDRALRTGTYDVVYIGSLGMGAYVRQVRRLAPKARVVLEQHNVEWEIFDRLVPSFRPALRPLVRHEAHLVRRYEARLLGRVDSVIAISATDARAFRALSGIDAVVVPPFVATRPPREELVHAAALVYVGALGWQPNRFGLDWICSDVWPLVRARVPDATLTIAGGGLPKDEAGASVMPAGWQLPGIRAVGFVEDLDDVYRDALALVAPVIGGSGVRMKLLEAFAAGMPTVTTTDGAAGLDLEDGRELLIADGPHEFADRVVRLLGDRALRDRLREGGRRFLAAQHSATAGRRQLERALGGGG